MENLKARQAVALWFEGVEMEKRASTETQYTPFDLSDLHCGDVRAWVQGNETLLNQGAVDISEYRIKPQTIN